MARPQSPLAGLRRVTPADVDTLLALFDTLPERDRSFLEHRLDRETIARWGADGDSAKRWLIDAGGQAHAYVAVIPGEGWSKHVGELRLVVTGDQRRRGLGRMLARHGLIEGMAIGLSKITVAVDAERPGDIEMFASIGFRAEALLEDHIRDSTGATHDLAVLCHDVRQAYEDLVAVGIDDAIGATGPA